LKKRALVEDERNRGFPAVLKYGPYLFLSGSEGHRDLETEQIVPDLAGKAAAQCRNSYGRIQRRLAQAGYPDSAVWIENFTSGQEWRLERMALWPEYFGQAGHGLAVSFGAQAKMWGLNMITTVVMAVTPELEREAVTHGSHVTVVDDPREAVAGADAVYTDVWVSMGDEAERAERLRALSRFQVTTDLMSLDPALPGGGPSIYETREILVV